MEVAASVGRSAAVLLVVTLGCRADSQRVTEPAQPVATEAPAPRPKAPACPPIEHLGVLFVGNSYMNLHDLPHRVAALGEARGIAMDVDKVTMGGESFEYHVGRAKTANKLSAREWDAVILQSHSLDPLRNHEGFVRAGAQLGANVREAGAEPLLFETWARRAGHNLYNYFKPAGGTPEAMQAAVTERYASLAKAEDMRVVPVGTAWMKALDTHPEIDLFAKDGGHPSAAGAYLGACVVFSVLTRLPPSASEDAAVDVAADAAAALRAVAVEVVQPACMAAEVD